jgi:23S rRNA (cytosine1962-C5)-methyltransferase
MPMRPPDVLYAFDATTRLDEALFRARIESAVGLRKALGLDDRRGAARLVNSEGDDLSGLIVDRYGDYLAVQVTALAMAARLETICDALETLVSPAGTMSEVRCDTTGPAGLRSRQ